MSVTVLSISIKLLSLCWVSIRLGYTNRTITVRQYALCQHAMAVLSVLFCYCSVILHHYYCAVIMFSVTMLWLYWLSQLWVPLYWLLLYWSSVCLCCHYAECYDALAILSKTILSVKILSLLSLRCHYPEVSPCCGCTECQYAKCH